MQAWQLSPNVGVVSSNAGQLVGHDSPTGEGIVLRPGKYNLPLSIGTLWMFKSFAIKIRVSGSFVHRQPPNYLPCHLHSHC